MTEKPVEVTPIEGPMTQEQHTAFIMRIFLYLVAESPNSVLEVDLNDVLAKTSGKLLQVRMEGATFQARITQGLTPLKPGDMDLIQ